MNNKDEKSFADNLLSNISKGLDKPSSIGDLLAAMLYYNPYQLPGRWYETAAIPNWFINDFLRFTLESPQYFREIGEADAYCKYISELMIFYHSRILNNPDSKLWQEIAMFVTQNINFIPLYFNNANLKDIYIRRAEIMEYALKLRGHEIDYTFPKRPTDRAKIRLGILSSHFSPQTETFSTLPVFDHSDKSCFEIILYAVYAGNHPLEQYCRSRADRFVKLPDDLPNQVKTIRADDLDIVLIGTNVTAVTNPITMLALHRLARIQLTSASSCVTTGMKNMDYYISGTLTETKDSQQQYREKLAMVQGAAHCFNYYAIPPEPAVVVPNRKEWNLSSESVIFVSGANFFKIIPEIREVWAKIIASVPNSVLMLYPFNPNWTKAYQAGIYFINHLKSVFAKYGVDPSRLIIINPLPSRADIKEYLKIADIYLDSYPFSGVNSLVDPLEVSLPSVVKDGDSFRSLMAPALLRELDIPGLIAPNEQAYIDLAVKLGTDPQLRQYYRERIRHKMADNPPFLDSRSYSAKIGNLFRQLFEEYQNRNGMSATSSVPDLLSDEFMNLLIGCANLYGIDPSSQQVIQQMRQYRKQLADFWLKMPSSQLESIYSGEGGVIERAILDSGFRTQPLLKDEGAFLQSLISELTAKTASDPPGAINYLLAAMLYMPKGRLNVQDARRGLPGWLIGDYEKFF